MKRRMLQQICALALTGSMLFGLTACGSSNPDTSAPGNSTEDGSSSPQEASDAEDKSAASSGGGDVSEMYWFSDVAGWGPATANWSVDESPATVYIKENLGLTLNIEQPPTDASTKLGLMLASGELPDVMSISDSDMYKQLVAADKVWDMQTL